MDIAVGEIAEDFGAAALERNVHEIKTGAFGQDFGIDLLIAADAGAAVADLARVFAGIGEKVGERHGGKIRRGREEEDRDIRERGDDLDVPLVSIFSFFASTTGVNALVEMLPIIRVWPSGRARAISSITMIPDAPGLFSTNTPRPKLCRNCSE